MQNTHQYDDIINLPHHVSDKRKRMTAIERGAQFSPFAALTGYDAAIKETARQTDAQIQLDEDSKQMLNERLHMILDQTELDPEISVTYFLPDLKKLGGAYVCVTGQVKKIDTVQHTLLMSDGTSIPVGDIAAIEGDVFDLRYND